MRKPEPLIYRGKTYPNQRALAKDINCAQSTISACLNWGFKLKDFEVKRIKS